MRVDMDVDQLLRSGREMFKHTEEYLTTNSSSLSLFNLIEAWSSSFERLAGHYLGCCATEALDHSIRLLSHRDQIGKDYGDVAMTWFPPTEIPAPEINPTIHHVPESTARRILGRMAA